MSVPTGTLINGERSDHVSVRDRGFQFGDGVFETIAVASGEPLLWERHMHRLQAGALRLGFTPPEIESLRREARQLCRDVERAVLKIMATRGQSTRGYAPDRTAVPTRVLTLLPWRQYPPQYALEGVSVRLCRARLARNPQLAGIKHLNRLEQVLARGEWTDDYAEGLMRDVEGWVIEGTRSNLFVVKDNKLLTPDLSQCGVEGVMRAEILERARRLQLEVDVVPLALEQVLAADELFLSNSLIGLWPVRDFEGKAFSRGEITKTIQTAIGDAHAR